MKKFLFLLLLSGFLIKADETVSPEVVLKINEMVKLYFDSIEDIAACAKAKEVANELIEALGHAQEKDYEDTHIFIRAHKPTIDDIVKNNCHNANWHAKKLKEKMNRKMLIRALADGVENSYDPSKSYNDLRDLALVYKAYSDIKK